MRPLGRLRGGLTRREAAQAVRARKARHKAAREAERALLGSWATRFLADPQIREAIQRGFLDRMRDEEAVAKDLERVFAESGIFEEG